MSHRLFASDKTLYDCLCGVGNMNGNAGTYKNRCHSVRDVLDDCVLTVSAVLLFSVCLRCFQHMAREVDNV